MNDTFEVLMKRVSPTLKRITYRLNGHYAFLNDEDLFQEALIHLWGGFKQGKLQDKTDSYILQGCHFHLKNYLRKTKPKARCVSLDSLADAEGGRNPGEGLLLEPQDPLNIKDYLHDKLLADTIRNNGFTTREKDILSFCAEGLTTRQMGAKLGISHVRVVKLISKIRDKCRKYID